MHEFKLNKIYWHIVSGSALYVSYIINTNVQCICFLIGESVDNRLYLSTESRPSHSTRHQTELNDENIPTTGLNQSISALSNRMLICFDQMKSNAYSKIIKPNFVQQTFIREYNIENMLKKVFFRSMKFMNKTK